MCCISRSSVLFRQFIPLFPSPNQNMTCDAADTCCVHAIFGITVDTLDISNLVGTLPMF